MLSTIHGINQWSCTAITAGHFITFLLNLRLLIDCYLLFTSCKVDVDVLLCISYDYCLDGLKGFSGQSECFLRTNTRCFDGTLGNKLPQRSGLELMSSLFFLLLLMTVGGSLGSRMELAHSYAFTLNTLPNVW